MAIGDDPHGIEGSTQRTMLAMTDSMTPTRVAPIEIVLLRIVLAFRVLGFVWMLLLVIGAFLTDDSADRGVVIAMTALAGGWTLVTIWLARSPDRIKSPWFAIADLLVAIVVANISFWAGAESNLYGGYPISSIAVIAYASDLKWTLGAGVVLFLNQWIGMEVEGSSPLTDRLGSVVFLVYAAIVGYGFDLIRERDALRRAAQEELEAQRLQDIRNTEQRVLADQLHDSVLQTLHAIRVDPSDPDQVTFLARRQENELRRTIRTFRSSFQQPFITAMFAARDDVEELYKAQIDMVCAYDAEMTVELNGLVEATREAMINAAKHSGSDVIIVHCSHEGGHISVLVRDRGQGFDPDGDTEGFGIANSIVRRMQTLGGTATVQSTEEFGTEVELTLQLR